MHAPGLGSLGGERAPNMNTFPPSTQTCLVWCLMMVYRLFQVHHRLDYLGSTVVCGRIHSTEIFFKSLVDDDVRTKIDQRRCDVSPGISKVSCNEMCVGVCVCRSVDVFFYLGVKMFCSETLSWSAFSTYSACIHVLRLYCTEYMYTGGVWVCRCSAGVFPPNESAGLSARFCVSRRALKRVETIVTREWRRWQRQRGKV